MLRKSPGKTPMQKLSHVTTKLATRGSQLIDSASTAVAQGAHLSNVVASRANAKAEEVAAQVPFPEKKVRRSRGGGGIRDRIHKFDSASKSHVEYHSTTPYNRRGSSNGGEATHRRHSRSGVEGGGGGGGGDETPMPRPVPPPYNPSFYEKENTPNRERSDRSLTVDDFDEKTTPTFRRKKNRHKREGVASHPINPHYREDEVEVVITGNETQGRRSRKNETETERNQTYESRNGYDKRKEDNDRRANIETMNIADLNRAAVIRNSTKETTSNFRSHSSDPSSNRHHNTTQNTSYGMGIQRTKKREKVDHPLIASPLRKHIKGVHDSACCNATCTVLKDPFPLLPPECARPLAAVANWEEDGSVGMGHLDTLGTVTGVLKSGGGRESKGTVKESWARDSPGGGGTEKRDGEEAALDLLTSAAFMFKHSRRNLG